MARFGKARWPQDGPIRDLLSYLDALHTAAGRPSMSEIGCAIALARSTVAEFFNGTRLIGRGNLELVVEYLGGDVAHAEALRRKAIVEWGTTTAPESSALNDGRQAPDRAWLPSRDDWPRGPDLLPPDLADFVGRETETAQILAVLNITGGAASAIIQVMGPGGVGKTSLVVRVAHRCVTAFPDGRLYVNLRDPNGEPVDPSDAIEGFLLALGMDVAAIPARLRLRVDAYRSRLAGRRVLVVLDNATSEAQVRPLLPASPGCAALVTSRIALAGLEGAMFVNLEVLDSRQATMLLTRIAGESRVAAEPQAAA